MTVCRPPFSRELVIPQSYEETKEGDVAALRERRPHGEDPSERQGGRGGRVEGGEQGAGVRCGDPIPSERSVTMTTLTERLLVARNRCKLFHLILLTPP